MGVLIRSYDWSKSPIGAVEAWPIALKTLVEVMLGSSQPMFVAWGAGRTLLYNDAYGEILASKHPAALGSDFLEVWSEIGADLEPIVEQAYTGQPVQMDDIELWMERRGFREETHFAFSYTPVRDEEGEISGFFCACREITDQIMAERQLRVSELRARESGERVQLALSAGAIIGTWVWDIPADRFTVDDAFADAFGIDPSLGHEGLSLDQVMATVHPDDKQGLVEAINEAIRIGGAYAHQYRVRRRDGQYYWIEANGRVEQGPDGTPARFPGVLLDVEERRRTEAALRASEEFNRRVLASSADCIKVLDLDGRLEFMSEGGMCVMEVDNFADVNGKCWADFWKGEEHDKALTAVDEAKRGGASRFQGFATTLKGSPRWWDVAVTPIHGADGKPEKLLCVSRDITTTMEIEATLRDTSRRLDAILNNTREAVFLMDHQQHCVYANAAAEKLTGYTFGEMKGRPLHDVVHHKKPGGSPYPLEECPIDRAFPQRAQMSGEELFVAPDGDFYPVAFTASPVLNEAGEPIGTVIEARNITEEKERDQALTRRSLQLQQLAETALQTASAPTLEATLEVITQAARRIVGAHQGVVSLTRGPDWSQAINTVALTDKYAQWQDYAEMPDGSGIYAWLCEQNKPIRMTQAELEAHPRWRAFGPHAKDHPPMRGWLAAPLIGRDGRNLGLVQLSDKEDGSEFDETDEAMLVQLAQLASAAVEQNLTETALREMAATLENRVAEEVAERSKAEAALRQAQKMEAVGQLTGGIAHDFNNLLTVVTGNIDMAARALDATGHSDARAQRALGNALKGAERAAALTQRLLAFSRRQPLAPKPVDPDRLVAGMSDLVHRALGETVKLEIVTSPGLWRVEADPNQLEAAILNLAVNARDAMPDGGTVTIETANARLDEAYAAEHAEVAPGQYVVIAVTDTGIGMSKETAARVFEPFFTTKEVGKGTGLGLSQVYGFTKQSGGHVKVYSEEGHGTTVKIYLPRLMSDAQAEDEAESPGVEKSRAQETILVVEDDDDVRAYTVECLRELGYRVIEAHDGTAALRLLERQEKPIDLLFTDVVMPGMTGRELADRARETQPDLKVLYTSGYTRNAIVHGGRLDEGVEMIGKPFTYAMLAEKVADMLEQGRIGRILLVEDEPTLRMFAAEALAAAGFAVDESATGPEAMARVRAARGRYDALILDVRLPGQTGDVIATEVRALHADLPILLASGEYAGKLAEQFAADRCTGVIGKPYNAAKLIDALDALGVRCRGQGYRI